MLIVDHIADILDLFEEQPELGVREIGRRLGISKSAAQRLAAKLAERNFLAQDPDTRHYRLGLRLLELGGLVQTQSEVISVAEPVLRALMRTTGETVHLAMLDDISVVYAAKVESTHSIRMCSRLGRLNPTYCTGVGKVILAYQPPELIERVIEHGLERHTPNTIVDPDELRRHLQLIRQQGFAFDEEEREIGLRCVAAPVRDPSGAVFAAVSVAGPAQRLPNQTMRALVASVRDAADRISSFVSVHPQIMRNSPPAGGQPATRARTSARARRAIRAPLSA
jgi:IclR family KDG regulon transcriptional repressor